MSRPEYLAHHGMGRGSVAPSRSAGGLLLRGVVTAVRLPDASDRGTDRRPEAGIVGVTCDVLLVEPRYTVPLRDVPLLAPSGGLNDHQVWVPRAATQTLSGESVNLASVDGRAVTDPTDLDGDWVLVGFIGNDLVHPVILGQIPHPRTNRRPSANDATPYTLRRWVRGIAMGITSAGDVEIDLSGSSDGTVQADGAEVANNTDATLTVTLGSSQKVKVDGGGGDPEGTVKGAAFLGDLGTFLGDLQTFASAVQTFASAVNGDTALIVVAPATVAAAGALNTAVGVFLTALGTFKADVSTSATADGATGGAPYASEDLKST